MSTETNTAERQAARDAGRERARLAAALADMNARKIETTKRITVALDSKGLTGKARADYGRKLRSADRALTLANVNGAMLTLKLRLVVDSDGKVTNRAEISDVLEGLDADGHPVRLAVTGTVRVSDMIRVTVDSLVK